MGLTKEESYEILELPFGVDQDSIRTSYKRLALKWHPDKHSGSGDALKKFQQVSRAYRKLSLGDADDKDITLEQMLSMFKDVFFSRTLNSFNGSGYDSSDDDDEDDDDDDDDDDDIEEDVRFSNLFPDKLKLKQDWKKAKAGEGDISSKTLSPEEIDRNAKELITEEEKEKRKAEKRRAKKKRRREKKKLEKQTEEQNISDKKTSKKNKESTDFTEKDTNKAAKKDKDKKQDSSSSSDGDEFDPTSAFFTKVVNKKKKSLPGADSQTSKANRKEKQSGEKSEDEAEELDPKVLRSRQLAIKGNEMAHIGEYTAAIQLFTEAVKLDPRDFRFFGNRSYCFDRCQQYEKALKDAEKAIQLAKDWPKGYFRKGRALAGLKMYADAEHAFMQVLKLDKNCEDAMQELLRVRTHQIMEMGFTKQQAEAAIKQYGSVQQALDSLLAGVVAENTLAGEVYVSDDEDGFTPASPAHVNNTSQKVGDVKMEIPKLRGNQEKVGRKNSPSNPEGLTALWVGNVLPEVNEKKLQQMFSRYGPVKSVRCLPEKYCAFVNFATKEAAGKAMKCLQGQDCYGQKLLIKFPDNPIVSDGNFTIRKNTANTSQKR
ncbi:hypothetical protein CHS0354_036459 [Potamilus streckersoni]|uniref:Uncharacterized protein n=1 Tax=Potamilus streckersoni TaxID=2493646 RepID=A0AAE0W299_9BIVA|nr:hypothetical protein CHS0354_036459 [Potamilus streckersoni]